MSFVDMFCKNDECYPAWYAEMKATGGKPLVILSHYRPVFDVITPVDRTCVHCGKSIFDPAYVPDRFVFALAHPETSPAYYGFGWFVVEQTPEAQIIAGPPEHAQWQLMRLASGLRGMGFGTYASAEDAKKELY